MSRKIKRKKGFDGKERRNFVRLDYVSPLTCKVCKKATVNRLLAGYIANISESGLLCRIKDRVTKGDILWLVFDRSTLGLCASMERRSLIYQNGIIGKVVWLKRKSDKTFDVGVQFITRQEKNTSYIYPKIHFLEQRGLLGNAAS